MDIPIADPSLDEECIEIASKTLADEYYLKGESVRLFEEEFAEFVQTEHAISVDSGTQALHLSLKALGITEGDKVLTTPATFIATANAIVRTGAEPVFVDIDLRNYTIDISKVREALRQKPEISAILPVHLYGHPVAMDELAKVAGDTPIVSDACQAHGATYSGQPLEYWSDLTAYSFYPSKNMTVAGDGGMITTDDNEVAATIRGLRDVGRKDETENQVHDIIGYTARLNTVNAAIGKYQLQKLDEWNERRRELAQKYHKELDGIGDLVLPPRDNQRESAWYVYTIRTEFRESLSRHLSSRGIETGINYDPPVHLQPPYIKRGYGSYSFPNTEKWAETALSIPVHQHMTDREVTYVIEQITEFFKEEF